MLKDRDIRQRIVGFVSFSFLTHVGLIAAAFLTPNMLREAKPGSLQAETYLIDSNSPAALGESAQEVMQELPAQGEILTAPTQDSEAVVVAANEIKEAPELKSEKQPESPKAVQEKAQAATKKVLALPPKKASTPKTTPSTAAIDQNEIAIQKALSQSRQAVTETEDRPEVAGDIEVPELQEQEGLSAAVVASEESLFEASDLQSATTTSSEDSQEDESAPTTTAVTVAPQPQQSALALPQKAATSPQEIQKAPQPTIAPIQKGGQQLSSYTSNSSQAGIASGTTTGAAAAMGGVAGGLRDADSLMEQPGNIKPIYAEADQRAGRQGTVIFDAMVTRDGRIEGVQIRQSSGYSTLDASAYEAFKKHRYLPGQEGLVRKKFQFVLNGEKTAPGKLRRR